MVRLFSIFQQNFRTEFKFPDRSHLNWFPGHMGEGILEMRKSIGFVDCVIEVHDARIPKSGRNKFFKGILGPCKPHILALNKMDLTDISFEKDVIDGLYRQGVENVVFTSCREKRYPGIKELISLATQLISVSNRYHRTYFKHYTIMITGVPNVGKSSLINAVRNIYMRGTKAAPVGAKAGITRSVSPRIKVSEFPLIYVLDTPGIIEPSVSDVEAALKLALCSAMLDHLVGAKNIADYLLFWLNKNKNFEYVNYMGLKEPTDDISEMLVLSAVYLKKTLKHRSTEGGYIIRPDTDFAAHYFIRGFRTGVFGRIMLDNNFFLKI